MGEWNGTCGVTQLPIIEGDRVVVFLLEKEQPCEVYSEKPIFPKDYNYKPILFPVKGVYDGYGSLKSVDEDKVMLADINESMNINSKSTIDLITSIERGVYKNINFMMVHEDMYNNLIYIISKEMIDYFNADFENFVFKIDETKVEISEMGITKDKISSATPYFHSKLSQTTMGNMLNNARLSKYYRLVYEKDKDIISKIEDIYYFKYVMMYLRKPWIPQVGSGSQTTGYKLFKAMGEYILKTTNERG